MMTDETRYGRMSDAELEDLVRGLPRRAPLTAVRARILAGASERPCRRSRLFRPAMAAAALVALLLMDVAAVALQNRQLAVGGMERSATVGAHAVAMSQQDTAWLREIGVPDGRLTLAMLGARRVAPQTSYRAFGRDLVQNGEGG
jgi:hypothetical protein